MMQDKVHEQYGVSSAHTRRCSPDNLQCNNFQSLMEPSRAQMICFVASSRTMTMKDEDRCKSHRHQTLNRTCLCSRASGSWNYDLAPFETARCEMAPCCRRPGLNWTDMRSLVWSDASCVSYGGRGTYAFCGSFACDCVSGMVHSRPRNWTSS